MPPIHAPETMPTASSSRAVGKVGHKADVVALERLQHHLVPSLLKRCLLLRSLLLRSLLLRSLLLRSLLGRGLLIQGFGRGLSLGNRHRILPCPPTIFVLRT